MLMEVLRALDYALQMAAGNFSGANIHVGGVNVYYNVCCSKQSYHNSLTKYIYTAVYAYVTEPCQHDMI